MSLARSLRRTLLVALASLALTSPTALARPIDQPARSTEAYVLKHSFDPYPTPVSYTHLTLPTNREV